MLIDASGKSPCADPAAVNNGNLHMPSLAACNRTPSECRPRDLTGSRTARTRHRREPNPHRPTAVETLKAVLDSSIEVSSQRPGEEGGRCASGPEGLRCFLSPGRWSGPSAEAHGNPGLPMKSNGFSPLI